MAVVSNIIFDSLKAIQNLKVMLLSERGAHGVGARCEDLLEVHDAPS